MLDFGFYNMDCMQGMKLFPDKYFDLSIVDPPYGIGVDGQKMNISKNPKHSRKFHKQKSWDNKIPDESYFRELEKCQKIKLYGVQIILFSIFKKGKKDGLCGIKVSMG